MGYFDLQILQLRNPSMHSSSVSRNDSRFDLAFLHELFTQHKYVTIFFIINHYSNCIKTRLIPIIAIINNSMNEAFVSWLGI
jgi:hypothetical protein